MNALMDLGAVVVETKDIPPTPVWVDEVVSGECDWVGEVKY